MKGNLLVQTVTLVHTLISSCLCWIWKIFPRCVPPSEDYLLEVYLHWAWHLHDFTGWNSFRKAFLWPCTYRESMYMNNVYVSKDLLLTNIGTFKCRTEPVWKVWWCEQYLHLVCKNVYEEGVRAGGLAMQVIWSNSRQVGTIQSRVEYLHKLKVDANHSE